jgi:hypothetical protein
MEPINVLSSIPSLGSLLGTSASPDLINQINANLPTQGVFGTSLDPFKEHYDYFNSKIVEPIMATHQQIQQLQIISTTPEDKIVSIYNLDQLQFDCPTAMHMPILLYPPVMKLYEQNLITAWGIELDKDSSKFDIYGDMIKGTIVDCYEDKEEGLVATGYWEADWPDLNFDELEDIKETREFIDQVLEETDFDPTDPSHVIVRLTSHLQLVK